MTSFEVWSLIISAFSAIGTVGAVAIALWATLHRRKRLVVSDIHVTAEMRAINDDVSLGIERAKGYVNFLLENRQQFQIEVMSITMMLNRVAKKGRSGPSGSGFGESMRGSYIPAQSQYEVQISVLGKEIPFSENEVSEITCEVKTSAGDVVVPFPDKWRKHLFDNLVFAESE